MAYTYPNMESLGQGAVVGAQAGSSASAAANPWAIGAGIFGTLLSTFLQPKGSTAPTPNLPPQVVYVTQSKKPTNWLLIGGLGAVGIIGAMIILKKKKSGKRK